MTKLSDGLFALMMKEAAKLQAQTNLDCKITSNSIYLIDGDGNTQIRISNHKKQGTSIPRDIVFKQVGELYVKQEYNVLG